MRFTPLLVGAAVALAITVLGAAFVFYTHSSLTKQLRAEVKQMAAEGKLPPELQGVNPEEITLDGFGIELSSGEMMRVSIADALSHFWYICIPLVFGLCIGGACGVSRIL